MSLILLAVALLEAWMTACSGADPAPLPQAASIGAVTVSAAGLFAVSPVRLLPTVPLIAYSLSIVSMLACATALIRAEDEATRRRHLLTLAVLAGILGATVLVALPRPKADVLLFQRASLDLLLAGANPYEAVFPDPYPPGVSSDFYGPGVSLDGILHFGYPYMPLTLIAALPGHLLGDVRVASLMAILASGLLVGLATTTREAALGAALLLVTPAFPVMLRTGWVESYVVLCVAATWYSSQRAPKLLPYFAGLLFASKQYMIISAPVLYILATSPRQPLGLLGFTLRVFATACVVTLPLALWNLPAFLESAAWLQFKQPFRVDALSFLAMVDPPEPRRWLGLPFLLAASSWAALLYIRRERRVSFPLALALTFAMFFAFNKQAFLNYYYLVIGCLCCAIAAEGQADAPTATAAR